MPWRLAVSILGKYYVAMHRCYYDTLSNCMRNGKYEEYIKSFFAELEKSDIDDYYKELFVDWTIESSVNYHSKYLANMSCMRKSERYQEWIKEQQKGFDEINQLSNLALERLKQKEDGVVFEDEYKYQKFVEIIVEAGGTFDAKIDIDHKYTLEWIYTYYITQGRYTYEGVKEYIENPDILNNFLDDDESLLDWKEHLRKIKEANKKRVEEELGVSYEEFSKLSKEEQRKLVQQKTKVSLSKNYDVERDGIPRAFDNVMCQKSLSEQWLEEKENKKLKNRVKRLFRKKDK